MRCLIVDDEPIARSILEKYIAKTPSLELAGSIDNALDVLNYLKEGTIDLMFLDINMPEFTGIDLLKSMRNPPAVVITTAYSEYGAESYEYDVVDYLMKPIPFERFLKAIQRVEDRKAEHQAQTNPPHLFLKEDHTTHKVLLADICYVQAYGNYIKVFLEDKTLLVRKTIAQMESETKDHLIRIHKSYLVSLAAIQGVSGNEVILNEDQRLPIGKVYKRGVEYLSNN